MVGTKIFTSLVETPLHKLLFGVKGTTTMLGIGGGMAMHSYIDHAEKAQKAWYGKKFYDDNFASSVDSMRTATTLTAGAAVGTAFLGPLAFKGAKAVGSSGLKLTGKALGAAYPRSYLGRAKRANKFLDRKLQLRRMENAFGQSAQRWRDIGNYKSLYGEKQGLLKRYRRRDRGINRRRPKVTDIKRKLTSPGAKLLGGVSMIGVGLGVGHILGMQRGQPSALEGTAINFGAPAQRRLNYSTAGLTMSLHNRANRTF